MSEHIEDLARTLNAPHGFTSVFGLRPVARANTEKLFGLLHTDDEDACTRQERLAISLFVTLLHDCFELVDILVAELNSETGDDSMVAAITELTKRVRTRGPYGQLTQVPIAALRPYTGIEFPSEGTAEGLGDRLAAALRFVHFLVFHPRDATSERLDALRRCGWTEDGIILLAQQVSFLTYQIRVVTGQRALDAAEGE